MENSANMILDQALELSAAERAIVAENYFLVLIAQTQKLMLFGQKRLTLVLRRTKKVKLKLYLQKRFLLSTVIRESNFS